MGVEEDKEVGKVVILDGSCVRSFVTDDAAFCRAADPHFRALDVNGDGVLSRAELRPAFERLNLIELSFGVAVTKSSDELNALYDSVFESFDTDHNNTVDLEEFRASLKEIHLAIADGLGSSPLTIIVENGSLLRAAADHDTPLVETLRAIDPKDIPGSAVVEVA